MRPWVAFLLILPLCAASCARGGKAEHKPQERASPSAQQAAQSEAGEVVSKREITLNRAASTEQSRPEAVRQSEQEVLLTLESAGILPEDFEIGPLADLVGVDRRTQEMISVTTRFLNALQDGEVAAETLEKNVTEELTQSIGYYLQRGLIPATYRIGAITAESPEDGRSSFPFLEDTAWMDVRLFGSPGVCEGQLYLERSAGRWYVSDLQINFEMMSQEYSREQEKYYPASYGWGIQ